MYYTKYRPQTFTDIQKPNEVADALLTQVKAGKVAHAYLFVGSRGTGKTTLARILAKALNCENPEKDGNPCLQCSHCKSIATNSYIDLIEIDAASNRGIDDIRDLKDRINLAPSVGTRKVYIIDEVHMLTTEAFNALLKTLEEPPKNVFFVLCTTELHKVPETVRSRCQVFKFKRATPTQLVEKLRKICDSEKIEKVTDADLQKIAQASFGGYRDAETLLQQVVEGNLDVTSFVSHSSHSVYKDFVGNLAASNTQVCLATIQKLEEDGIDLHSWVFGLLTYLRELLLVSVDVPFEQLESSEEEYTDLKELTTQLSIPIIVSYIEEFSTTIELVNSVAISKLPLEVSIVKLCLGFPPQKLETDVTPPKHGGSKPEAPQNSKKVIHPAQDVASDSEDIEALAGFADMFSDEDLHEDAPTVVEESVGGTKVALVAVEEITSNWDKIVRQSVSINSSIHALLKAVHPLEIQGDTLILEVSYKFHKERLESPKTRDVVESVIRNVVGSPLSLSCIINASKRPNKKSDREVGDLTDHNLSAPAFLQGKETPANIMDVFDGGLPL